METFYSRAVFYPHAVMRLLSQETLRKQVEFLITVMLLSLRIAANRNMHGLMNDE